ncbi:MAG: hypothetical protein HYS04_11270 [Acidobacteria bacterium]|nr:hypothetical protein [Acidobacteriota bacterium]
MKKHNAARKKQVKKDPKALTKTKRTQIRAKAAEQRLTIGLDLDDRTTRYCILDAGGEVVSEGELATTKTGLNSSLEKMPSSRVALEVGTQVGALSAGGPAAVVTDSAPRGASASGSGGDPGARRARSR